MELPTRNLDGLLITQNPYAGDDLLQTHGTFFNIPIERPFCDRVRGITAEDKVYRVIKERAQQGSQIAVISSAKKAYHSALGDFIGVIVEYYKPRTL